MIRHALLPLLLAAPLHAQTAPVSQTPASQADVLQAELRPGWRTADGRQMAALHLHLAPHWKTYWRAPGDAGIPPEFDWAGSQNLGSVKVHWPSPEVFDFQGMKTIGYRQDVVLPVEITPADPAQPVLLNAAVLLGVCNDICMPASLALSATLSQTGAPDPMIETALAETPLSAAEAGLSDVTCKVEEIEDGLRVTARLALPPATGPETVVMEPETPVWVSDAEVTRTGNALTAVADFVPPPGASYQLDPTQLRLTVLAEGHAMETTGCPVE